MWTNNYRVTWTSPNCPSLKVPLRAVAHGRRYTLSSCHVCSLCESDTPDVALLPKAAQTCLRFPPQSHKTNEEASLSKWTRKTEGLGEKKQSQEHGVRWINDMIMGNRFLLAVGLGAWSQCISLCYDHWCRREQTSSPDTFALQWAWWLGWWEGFIKSNALNHIDLFSDLDL